MITPEQLEALADSMRVKGVRRLRTPELEIDLGPEPKQRAKFDLEERADDEKEQKSRAQRLIYGSSQ